MKTIAFHYYNGAFSSEPTLDRRNPIIFAISSARRHNPNTDIVVFENCTQPQDWRGLPKLLNFRVRPSTEMYFTLGHPICNSRSMLKLWDLTEGGFMSPFITSLNANHISLGKDQDYLYMDRLYIGAEGCFSFNCLSERSIDMIQNWKAMCLLFVQSPMLQKSVLEFCNGQEVSELTIFQYMSSKNMYQTHGLSPAACVPMYHLVNWNPVIESVVLSDSFCGFDKVRVIAAFKELRNAVNWELLVKLIPEYKDVETADFSLWDICNPERLDVIKKFMGAGFERATEPFWVPPQNFGWRSYQHEAT